MDIYIIKYLLCDYPVLEAKIRRGFPHTDQSYTFKNIFPIIYTLMINKPGVARAVLQTPS